MNKTTEALKLAQEALETAFNLLCFPVDSIAEMYCLGMGDCDEARKETKEALAVIREALAEPVAWKRESDGALFRFEVHEGLTPLYAPSVSLESEWIETNKALAKEIIEQRNQYLDMLAEAVDLSVKAEREACAKVCDVIGADMSHPYVANNCAAAIRARGCK